jgi:4-hydroxy-tetrahydrodipicolinate reductase
MVKIALIGYGRMGQTIETIARQKGHDITAIIDPSCPGYRPEISRENLTGVEVCIDFTHPAGVVENIRQIAQLGKNMVIGTTGWYNHLAEVQKIVEENQVGLIWSGNFSIGVNALFKIVEHAAKLFNRLDDYDVLAHDFHHKDKADSPSGTAIMLGKILIDNIERKKKLVFDQLERKIAPDELHFSSSRGGAIPGTHMILFDSAVDTIEIKHTARSREGFAAGAVMAAEFIQAKTGFYTIDDLMQEIIGGTNNI